MIVNRVHSVALIMVFSLVGCGKKNSQDLSEADQQRSIANGTYGGSKGVGALLIGTTMTRFCTAVEIGNRCLLTAAHCLMQGAVYQNGSTTVPIKQRLRHPRFRDAYNDIGLIFTEKKAGFSWNVVPIGNAKPKKGDSVRIEGWGISNLANSPALRSGTMKVEGSYIYSSGGIHRLVPNSSNQITCRGDSGGPTFYKNQLIGIHSESTGGPCSQSVPWGHYSYETDVTSSKANRDFIALAANFCQDSAYLTVQVSTTDGSFSKSKVTGSADVVEQVRWTRKSVPINCVESQDPKYNRVNCQGDAAVLFTLFPKAGSGYKFKNWEPTYAGAECPCRSATGLDCQFSANEMNSINANCKAVFEPLVTPSPSPTPSTVPNPSSTPWPSSSPIP